MRSWIGPTHVYGCLANESPDSIAPLIVNALSHSNYTRMVLVVDSSKRVLLIQERSKRYAQMEKEAALGIGPIYRCGRNPARFGLTVATIAEDIRETMEAMHA